MPFQRKFRGRGGADDMVDATDASPVLPEEAIASKGDYVELVYNEVVNSRSASGDSFSQGVIDWNWNSSGITTFIPSKSYIRLELEFLNNANGQPIMSDLVAPSFDIGDCLFSSFELLAGGQSISALTSNTSQAGSLRKRLRSSYGYKKSVGETHMLDMSFGARQKVICSDSSVSLSDNDYEPSALTTVLANQRGGNAPCGITISAVGVVAGVNTEFQTVGLSVGDKLVVRGIEYDITSITSNTVMTVNAPGAIIGDVANPANPTTDCYALKVKSSRKLSQRKNKIFVNFTPSLGIFDYDQPLCAGSWTLRANPLPQSDINSNCLENLGGWEANAPNAGWKVVVRSCNFYVATVKANLMNSIVSLPLVEYNIQSKQCQQNSTYQFTVPTSTNGLVIFFQSNSATKDGRITGPMFKNLDNSHLDLRSLQVNYANVRKQASLFSSEFGGVVDHLQQYYKNTFADAGLDEVNSVGCESFNDWLNSPFYYFSFLKGDDKSTEVQVSANFGSEINNTSIYCVALYGNLVEISSSNGSIVNVRSRNI